MFYDIGIFCVILAALIGVISIMFSLPKIRGLKLIAILLVLSGVLVSLGTTLEVLQTPPKEEKEAVTNE